MENSSRRMFDLQLFGPVQLAGRRLSLTSSAKLLALLARRPDGVWTRSELGNTLWPDADESSARNRIRTALTEIRRTLRDPKVLVGAKNDLSLVTHDFTCDLWQAHAWQRRVRIATDRESELIALHRLSELLAAGFMPEFSDAWVVAERTHWIKVMGETCVRISELESDFDAVLASLALWIQQDPYNERAWELMLLTGARLGRSAAVAAEFDAIRARLRAETGGRFSRGLLDLAHSVRKNRHQATGLTPTEAELVRNTFERMVASNPAEAAAFLGSKSFRPEVFRDPEGSAKLLLQALEIGIGAHDDLMNCRVGLVISAGLRFDHDQTIRFAREIMELDHDPIRRRGATSGLCFAYSKKLDWEQSHYYANQSLEIATQIGDPVGIAIAEAQIGNICLVQCDTAQAIARYQAMLAILDHHDTLSANNGRASGLCNLGNALYSDGQLSAGLATLRRGFLACEETNQPLVKEQHLALYGLMLIEQGSEVQFGLETFMQGVASLMRLNAPPMHLSCVDAIAVVCSRLGYPSHANAALQLGKSLRAKSNLGATPLELRECERAAERCRGYAPDPEWSALTSPQILARRALKLLQSHAL